MQLQDVIQYLVFMEKEKKTVWSARLSYPAVTDTLLTLLSPPIEKDIDQSILEHIERFIVVLYSKTCFLNTVN